MKLVTFEDFLTSIMLDGETVRLVPTPSRDGIGVEFFAKDESGERVPVNYLVIGDKIHKLNRQAGT